MALFQSDTKGKWNITLPTATECKTKKQSFECENFQHTTTTKTDKKSKHNYTHLFAEVNVKYMISKFEHQIQADFKNKKTY